MDYLESVLSLNGLALDDFARALYDADSAAFERVIVGLVRYGTMRGYESVATMLSNVPQSGNVKNGDYYSARYGEPPYKRYVDMFLRICGGLRCTESEYIALFLAAQYGNRNGALYRWDESIDLYLARRASEDFSLIADYIDKYDRRFRKYGVLLKVDRVAAVRRLLDKAINGKKINKTAVRDVLMDCGEAIDILLSRYAGANARERAAIARVLMLFKNDVRVREFLSDVVNRDKSETVRAVFVGKSKKHRAPAPEFFESLMTDGKPLDYAEWRNVFRDKAYETVADGVFFLTREPETGVPRVLAYNGGEFIDMSNRRACLSDAQKIFVLHPLDVPQSARGILDLRIDQPILQIARPIYHALSGESYYSDRLFGTMLSRREFDDNLKRYGFVFCDKRSEADPDIAIKRIGGSVIAVECDMPPGVGTVSCGKLAYYAATDVVKLNRKLYLSTARPQTIGDVPRREFSELTYAAYKLFDA